MDTVPKVAYDLTRAKVDGRRRRVQLPVKRGGRRLVAKTCKKCGHLVDAPGFAITGSSRVHDPICRRCHANSRVTLPPTANGRTIIAKTCLSCERIRLTAEFPNRTDRASTDPWCNDCAAARTRSWSQANPDKHRSGRRRTERRYQTETIDTATNRGKEWNGAEIEILLRDDITIREKARMLNRTYGGVRTMNAMVRTDPKWMRVAGGPNA